ncbi:thiamine pyrophosphate-binding protein [Zhihengliuella flava]|uniref:Thiamine pyrophosphate-dependent acetolactate synthase large subunit-like protein n=1 Tax=Zhihengliuella flava TaxID=1285193 RepID=A0A931GF39_9MICC|nr:thiamine pyrophosphate-binding protein [Zhihengliuella flava]MBG6084800.1 thiamine pyrophosphate-dependent acetolactate synthase large subunit-like protein [Zhihengliuella flava]
MNPAPSEGTVSAAVAQVVATQASDVFALMGNGNAYFTDALARATDVRVTAVRHEQATVASADAYHRATRRIAVATTTYGPGFTNTLTALAEAALARIPLVFVVGDAPASGRRPWDLDQKALAEATGALTLTVNAATPRADTLRAFALATSQRRPVALFIPHDVAGAPAQDAAPDQKFADATQRVRPEHSTEARNLPELSRAVQILAQAKRPLILAGRGARHAAAELGDLADRLGALTASTAPARGTFAGREWDLGVCGGFASEASSALIHRADVVLAAGAALNQFTTSFGDQFASDAVVVQIDIEDLPTAPRVDLHLSGDSRAVTRDVLTALADHPVPTKRWAGEAPAAQQSQLSLDRDPGSGIAADGRLDPRSAMVALNTILPQRRQIVSDGGHFIGWANGYFDVPEPDSLLLVGTHFQAIGLGFPAAPGALRARPDVTTVLVTGDGGGLMGISDLDTVIRQAASAVVLVFNDACYGAEIHQYGSRGFDEAVMEIDEVDFAGIARGHGAEAAVVKTMDDLETVRTWVSEGARGTLVVDLRISRTVVAPFLTEIIDKTMR